MNDLTKKTCVPCRADTPPLRGQAIEGLVRALRSDWRVVDGKRLERKVRFDDFAGALAFANEVGELAEREGHHPDLLVRWGECGITLWTHTIGGLSENDFVLAAKIDALGGAGESSRKR